MQAGALTNCNQSAEELQINKPAHSKKATVNELITTFDAGEKENLNSSSNSPDIEQYSNLPSSLGKFQHKIDSSDVDG